MKNTKDVVALIVDKGIFLHVARKMASEFKKVYYTTNPDDAYPTIERWCWGDGYPEIEWVESTDAVSAQIDLAIYTDIGREHEQMRLQRQGVRVWGSGPAGKIESSRGLFLRELAKTNLPIPDYQDVVGVDNLRVYLKDKEDKFIKVSKWRGDVETKHWRSWKEDFAILDKWAQRFGPFRNRIRFYVLDPVETEIEGGADGWHVDGQWPVTMMHGFECKDKAYLMTFVPFQKIPDEIRVVNEEMGKVLNSYKYAGPFSTEVRVTDDHKSYFLDPTCRYASPVSQAQCEMVDNLGEIAWKGANGIMTEPKYRPENRFGAQVGFYFNRTEWNYFKIPKEIEGHVKISDSCLVDGVICVPPNLDEPDGIGWLCATGSSIEYAIHNIAKYADLMPCGVEVKIAALVDLLKEVHQSQDAGMKFTDKKVPEPASVID